MASTRWEVSAGEVWTADLANDLHNRIANTVEAIATNTVSAAETRSSTSYGDLASTGPQVTVTLASTKAAVFFAARESNDSDNVGSLASVAVSGASTVAASDARALELRLGSNNNFPERAASVTVFNGLSTGSNTFTMKYRNQSASTGSARFQRREMFVFPLEKT